MMPTTPDTPLGPAETLVDRVSTVATEAAGVQATTVIPTGVRVDVHVVGDSTAAVREAMAALFDHMLAATRHPVVASFLLHYRDQIGL